MINLELLELKNQLKKLENEYISNFDSYSIQENKYFLTDIKNLKKKIKELESTEKVLLITCRIQYEGNKII